MRHVREVEPLVRRLVVEREGIGHARVGLEAPDVHYRFLEATEIDEPRDARHVTGSSELRFVHAVHEDGLQFGEVRREVAALGGAEEALALRHRDLRELDASQQLRCRLNPLRSVVMQPTHHGLKHFELGTFYWVRQTQQLSKLSLVQSLELIKARDLSKVFGHEMVGLLGEVVQAERFCDGRDVYEVVEIKLRGEVRGARRHDRPNLQMTRCAQNVLHVAWQQTQVFTFRSPPRFPLSLWSTQTCKTERSASSFSFFSHTHDQTGASLIQEIIGI